MENKEAVFVFPVRHDDNYGYFVFLGKRLKEDSAKEKWVPPMGRREGLKLFGIKTPFKESFEKTARRELREETGKALKVGKMIYVGGIADKSYEPSKIWDIKVYAALVSKIKKPMESNEELKINNSWFNLGCEDSLLKEGLMNRTTYNAFKMVSDYLKGKN
jgi:ADP-ribose pyrophosphatase YjhB (NUDIX family)